MKIQQKRKIRNRGRTKVKMKRDCKAEGKFGQREQDILLKRGNIHCASRGICLPYALCRQLSNMLILFFSHSLQGLHQNTTFIFVFLPPLPTKDLRIFLSLLKTPFSFYLSVYLLVYLSVCLSYSLYAFTVHVINYSVFSQIISSLFHVIITIQHHMVKCYIKYMNMITSNYFV